MISFVIERLERIYDRYRETRRDDRQLADDALRAISTALRETKIYYATLERGQVRSADSELQLSRLWAEAAIPLRHVDMELAQVCEYKSDYWLNPETWIDERVEEVSIQLENVDARFRSLLTK